MAVGTFQQYAKIKDKEKNWKYAKRLIFADMQPPTHQKNRPNLNIEKTRFKLNMLKNGSKLNLVKIGLT